MSLCQNLRRSPGDVVLNTILLLTIIFAYARQIYRLNTSTTKIGLSPFFILYNTLFATTQYSNYLLFSCYHYPILSCIAKRELCTLDAYGALLGLLQVAFIWLGSIMYLITYVKSSHQRTGTTTKMFVTLLATAHIIIFLVPTALYALPRASEMAMNPPTSRVMVLISKVRDPFAEVYALLALISQTSPRSIDGKERIRWSEWDHQQQMHQARRLDSILSWQTVCFITVGLAWLVRMNGLDNRANDKDAMFRAPDQGPGGIWSWYANEAWPWLNWLFYGLGQGALVSIEWYRGRERRTKEADGYVLLRSQEV